jgi:hypothetical protein
LLDYAGYVERHGIKPDHFSCTGIPVEHLQDVVREQGVTFEPGDIVLVRIGFIAAYDALTKEQQNPLPLREVPAFMGPFPDKGHTAVALGDQLRSTGQRCRGHGADARLR